jgi:hypothetical protein
MYKLWHMAKIKRPPDRKGDAWTIIVLAADIY